MFELEMCIPPFFYFSFFFFSCIKSTENHPLDTHTHTHTHTLQHKNEPGSSEFSHWIIPLLFPGCQPGICLSGHRAYLYQHTPEDYSDKKNENCSFCLLLRPFLIFYNYFSSTASDQHGNILKEVTYRRGALGQEGWVLGSSPCYMKNSADELSWHMFLTLSFLVSKKQGSQTEMPIGASILEKMRQAGLVGFVMY